MPIYMDVHIVPGIKARDAAEAHQKDLALQEEYSCKCMTYWVDEKRENVFCLIEAPEKHVVEEMHKHAHGLIPHQIIEVSSVLVESFLGRTIDPEVPVAKDGLKIFHEPSLRILLATKITDPALLHHDLGKEKAGQLIGKHHNIIRENLAAYNGREAEFGITGFVASFSSAVKAVACAQSVQKDMSGDDMRPLGFSMGIHAGEPVTNNDKLFGETIQVAKRICTITQHNQVAVTSTVKELVSPEYFRDEHKDTLLLSPRVENMLGVLFDTLEENYSEPGLNMDDYCQKMAMSKSQLYRKTVELFGLSPNALLKEFRLEKAVELMRKQRYNIAEITFNSGFTSPSYFTKCFKKKYGLLPMAYLDLSH